MSPQAALTIEQIDDLLAAWEERLRRMDDNLIDLEGQPAYQILAGKAGRRAPLDGVSRERVHPALDAVTELFQHRERLADVVKRARAVRASISALAFWDKDQKLAEIAALLRAPSIDLGPRVTPLAERSLLDAGYHDVVLAPESLLAAMVKTFHAARDVILAVARAQASLAPAIGRIERELAGLSEIAASVAPGGALPELADAARELADLKQRAQRDPLGAEAAVGAAILPRLAAIRARLELEAGAMRRATAALAEAHALRARLAEAHARALSHVEETARAIPGAALAPALEQPLLDGLDLWLQKLDATVAARRFRPAEVGLARFREAAERYLAIDVAATETAAAALARWKAARPR